MPQDQLHRNPYLNLDGGRAARLLTPCSDNSCASRRGADTSDYKQADNVSLQVTGWTTMRMPCRFRDGTQPSRLFLTAMQSSSEVRSRL